MQVCAPRQNKWQQIKRLVMLWHPSRYNCDRGRIMHNSSFCRMAFTLCICLLFSGCAASLSDANAKGKETVTESTSQTDSVDLTQPSDGSSDAESFHPPMVLSLLACWEMKRAATRSLIDLPTAETYYIPTMLQRAIFIFLTRLTVITTMSPIPVIWKVQLAVVILP